MVSNTALSQPARRRSWDRYGMMPVATPVTLTSAAPVNGDLSAMCSLAAIQVTESPSPTIRTRAFLPGSSGQSVRSLKLLRRLQPNDPITSPDIGRVTRAKANHRGPPNRADGPEEPGPRCQAILGHCSDEAHAISYKLRRAQRHTLRSIPRRRSQGRAVPPCGWQFTAHLGGTWALRRRLPQS